MRRVHAISELWMRVFFAVLHAQLSTHALATTAWICLIPLAVTFTLVFKLPRGMHS